MFEHSDYEVYGLNTEDEKSIGSFESQDSIDKFISPDLFEEYNSNYKRQHGFFRKISSGNMSSYSVQSIPDFILSVHPMIANDEYFDACTLDDTYKHLKRNVKKRNTMVTIVNLLIISFLFSIWFYKLIKFSINNGLYNLIWIPLAIMSIFVLLFPVNVIVGGIYNTLGPINFFFQNSKYYSCGVDDEYFSYKNANEATNNTSNTDISNIPNIVKITIKIPVYKEDFTSVISKTLKSAMLCREYYKNNSSYQISVNILVCDDGLQLISDEDAKNRIIFYNENEIGYIAREKENRSGKFKKASNMNFAMDVSTAYDIEKRSPVALSNATNNNINDGIANAVNNTIKAYKINDNATVMAGNDISIGQYVLLLDSDTRIPYDCLHHVIFEFDIDKKLAFTQHLTHPLIITNTYWEKFIAHFTNLIYSIALPISTAGGDVSPLVGHCAIIRTSALDELRTKNGKVWSENNVSEDFRLFMDLILLGYYGRYITYTTNINAKDFDKHNFMEGISLEYFDELSKFKKYAYGTCEILLNPFNMWFTHGVFGKSIKDYCCAKIEFTSKFGVISYLSTYVAIGISFPLTYINYFMFGWFRNEVYIKVLPLHVVLQVVLLFSGMATLTNSIFKARVTKLDTVNIFWDNISQIPLYSLFFGSVPYHIFFVMVKYLMGCEELGWGSTNKEVNNLSRIGAIKSTISELHRMYILFSTTLIFIIILWMPIVPEKWRITNAQSIAPLLLMTLLHLLGPILLNPYITTNVKIKNAL